MKFPINTNAPSRVLSLPILPPLPREVLAGKVPEWNISDLVKRVCPVCCGEDSVDICQRPDQLIVTQCTSCGMIYVPLIPSGAQLRSFYSGYAAYKSFHPPSLLRSMVQRVTLNPHLSILESTGGIRGLRLCEVGSSYGHFLLLCRHRGANVQGVEWDNAAVNYLEKMGVANSRELPDDTAFDVICAFQLMEHLEDPQGFLRKVASSLVHDGRLLLSLPNGGEIDNMGPAWPGFRVDLEHLNYFSISSLCKLLRTFGLYVEHYWEYGQPQIPRQRQDPARRNILRTFVNGLLGGDEPKFSNGRFVLSILARKIESNAHN